MKIIFLKKIFCFRAAAVFLIATLAFFLCEISVPGLFTFLKKEPFTKDKLRQALESPRDSVFESAEEYPEAIVHPYLGFIFNPLLEGVNPYGFNGPNPITRRSGNQVNVVITGGSVAVQFFSLGSEFLEKELRKIPALADKRFTFISLAVNGFKQPQQLCALQYMVLLGAEYDIVINLDGFNEVAIPYGENFKHTATIYPRSWYLAAMNSQKMAPAFVAQMDQIYRLRSRRAKIRKFFLKPLPRLSSTLLAIGYTLDRIYEKRQFQSEEKLKVWLAKDPSPLFSGIMATYNTPDEVLPDAVEIWASASLQMARLCKINGIRYFHFLQPNQHLEGSKNLSQEELNLIAQKTYVNFSDAVKIGYPMLIRMGAQLKQAGVPFVDFSDVFRDVDVTVYYDGCCHFNLMGISLMAMNIAATIALTY